MFGLPRMNHPVEGFNSLPSDNSHVGLSIGLFAIYRNCSRLVTEHTNSHGRLDGLGAILNIFRCYTLVCIL